MKRIFTLLVALIILSPLTVWPAVVGDVDGDGNIGLEETIYSLQVVAGLMPPTPTTPSIIGSWWLPEETPLSDEFAVLTFLDDTYFSFSQFGDSTAAGDPNGEDGMELGTYSWNPSTGEFTVSLMRDTNGEWGLSHPQGTVTVSVDGNILTMIEDTSHVELTRVAYYAVQDCNGVVDGTAYEDNCGNCVGGNTGQTACTLDCNYTYDPNKQEYRATCTAVFNNTVTITDRIENSSVVTANHEISFYDKYDNYVYSGRFNKGAPTAGTDTWSLTEIEEGVYTRSISESCTSVWIGDELCVGLVSAHPMTGEASTVIHSFCDIDSISAYGLCEVALRSRYPTPIAAVLHGGSCKDWYKPSSLEECIY